MDLDEAMRLARAKLGDHTLEARDAYEDDVFFLLRLGKTWLTVDKTRVGDKVAEVSPQMAGHRRKAMTELSTS